MSSKWAVSLVTDAMVETADAARNAFLRDNPGDDTGALRAALETAMDHGFAAVKTRWLRGSDGDGMSPTAAELFPISPFEAWYIMRGYEVAIQAHFSWDDDGLHLFGKIEGGRAGLMLKE